MFMFMIVYACTFAKDSVIFLSLRTKIVSNLTLQFSENGLTILISPDINHNVFVMMDRNHVKRNGFLPISKRSTICIDFFPMRNITINKPKQKQEKIL